MKRKIILWALTAALTFHCCAPTALADTTDAAQAAEDEPYLVLDEAELSSLVGAYMKKNGIKDNNFAVSYCYTGTGETWSLNGDRYINGASLYKLSLIMWLAKKVAAGELGQEDVINGWTVSHIENRALVYSDNDVGEAMIAWCWNHLGSFAAYRLMQAGIAGVPEDALPAEYFSSNSFSSNFMLGVLQELYGNPEQYPTVIDRLLEANTKGNLILKTGGGVPIAHKYGGGDGYLHTAAIVYTPTPFLACVMTYRVSNAQAVLSGVLSLLEEYTRTLDQRIADHEAELARRAEEVRQAEEAARLADEDAERQRLDTLRAARAAGIEQQRKDLEEAARLASDDAARLRQRSEENIRIVGELLGKGRSAVILRCALFGAGAAGVLALCLGLAHSAKKKKAAHRRAARRRAARRSEEAHSSAPE